METKKEELTLPTYEERWEVRAGKEVYVLNERQIALLKKLDEQGHRGIVWFDGIAISIPHIQSAYRVYRGPKKEERKIIRYEIDNEKSVAVPVYE